MLFSNFDAHTWKLFWGNVLLLVCGLFYLAWWAAVFAPNTASKGLKPALLLVGAMVTGILAVVLLIRGIRAIPQDMALFPAHYILWGGAAAYLVLLAISSLVFRRQVTTELMLIVGWAMLVLSEINALYGAGRFGIQTARIFSIGAVIAAVICLICYMLYYRLPEQAGYIDGMIPLILEAFFMAGICVAMAF